MRTDGLNAPHSNAIFLSASDTLIGNWELGFAETTPEQLLGARQAVNLSLSLSSAKRVVRKPEINFANCASTPGPTPSDAM